MNGYQKIKCNMESKYKIGDTKTLQGHTLQVVAFDKYGFAVWQFVGVEDAPDKVFKGGLLIKEGADDAGSYNAF